MCDAGPGSPATGVAALMRDVRSGSLDLFDLAADLSARELGRVDVGVGDAGAHGSDDLVELAGDVNGTTRLAPRPPTSPPGQPVSVG
jgi:hypothetical protein